LDARIEGGGDRAKVTLRGFHNVAWHEILSLDAFWTEIINNLLKSYFVL
jgi:hypothetical protein